MIWGFLMGNMHGEEGCQVLPEEIVLWGEQQLAILEVLACWGNERRMFEVNNAMKHKVSTI